MPRSRIVVAFGASSRATQATGPVSSLKLLIAALEEEFEIAVLAKRELGLPWTAEVSEGVLGVVRFLREDSFDVLYINSFFDREYTMPLLAARRLGLIPRRPTVVAPRGELLGGALRIKSAAKRSYIGLVRASGLMRDVWLQATSRTEYEELSKSFGWVKGTLLAEEICAPIEPPPRAQRRGKALRVVFLSRISEKKNLDYALTVLRQVRYPVEFEIFGPKGESAYWAKCERLIEILPAHIEVSYKGTVANEDVPRALVEADLFFLPTKSENFGYAIYEALACGVPVLISDQTPWLDLERRSAGWDLPLNEIGAFARVIEMVCKLDEAGRNKLCAGARARAASYLAEQDAIASNRRMFRQLVRKAEQ